MSNIFKSPIPYTLEQLLMLNPDLEYHHTATVPGYVSRKAGTEIITQYKGRFGRGFIVHRARCDSTRYHDGAYYIFKED